MSSPNQENGSKKLEIIRDESKTEVRQMTEAALNPAALSAYTAVNFSQFAWGDSCLLN